MVPLLFKTYCNLIRIDAESDGTGGTAGCREHRPTLVMNQTESRWISAPQTPNWRIFIHMGAEC